MPASLQEWAILAALVLGSCRASQSEGGLETTSVVRDVESPVRARWAPWPASATRATPRPGLRVQIGKVTHMRTSVRLTLVALAASVAFAAAVGTASAGRFSTSNQFIRATWSSLEFTVASVVVRCPVTLEGSFHSRTIVKVTRALIGAITRATVNQTACREGKVYANNGIETIPTIGVTENTLPWHLTYESFAGTLPSITRVTLLLARFRWTVDNGIGICRYGRMEDTISIDANRELVGGRITSLIPVEGRNRATRFEVPLFGICGAEVTFRGNGELFLLNTTTRITLTLI